MVAEVPALDDRVKAVMEAEAAMDAQSERSRQGELFSEDTSIGHLEAALGASCCEMVGCMMPAVQKV